MYIAKLFDARWLCQKVLQSILSMLVCHHVTMTKISPPFKFIFIVSTVSNLLIPCVNIQNLQLLCFARKWTRGIFGSVGFMVVFFYTSLFHIDHRNSSAYFWYIDNFSLHQCISQLEFCTALLFSDTFTEFGPVFHNSCLEIPLNCKKITISWTF